LLPHGVPVQDGNERVEGCNSVIYYEAAWMKYDGKMIQQPTGKCLDGHCEPIDEYTNADPPLRIYNKDYPPYDEQALQFIAANVNDRDKVFNFTCSHLTQLVSTSGENQAWAVRTGITADPAHAFITPPFFRNNTTANLQFYGRQRNGIPYGAATFPFDYDLLNSGPLYLQNQYYQKDNKSIFAGRPYGCTGESCNYVGYCSENPNVICAYYPPSQQSNTGGVQGVLAYQIPTVFMKVYVKARPVIVIMIIAILKQIQAK
jgi:hypothetical protein